MKYSAGEMSWSLAGMDELQPCSKSPCKFANFAIFGTRDTTVPPTVLQVLVPRGRQKMADDFARLKAWRAQSGTEGRDN